MDANEATTIVLSKIKGIDPENASKIMGYLLIQDLTEKDLIRLAFGPETLLHSLILKAKTQMGLLSSTLASPTGHPNALTSLSLPTNPNSPGSHLLPQTSPRIAQRCELDGARNNLSAFSNNVMRHGSNPSLPFGNTRVGSPFFPSFNGGGFVGGASGGDFVEESDYFSFLNDGGKPGEGAEMGYGVNNVDSHFHKRSYSESDVGFGYEDGGENSGCRPCLYFARGFCKNGSSCKFLHGSCADDLEGPLAFVGSPSGFDHEELMRLKVARQQRLTAASQFMPGMSPTSQGKYFSMLLQQPNDAHRLTMPGMAAGEELYKYGRFQPERSDFLAMGLAEKANSASRQIYLTFPADSTFKDEDVSEYFSKYGPVQDVRIPYQQKRMFGFVTFVYPETVKLILAKGNPHFICNSRVLVKPYKEKGKVPDKRQQHQQQLFERGDFSPSSSFLLLDSGEPYDHPGVARAFHNSHEMVLRRKFEEQANLQQAIEFHSRRLMNLQLPDLKDDGIYHHMRSFSVGSPVSPSIHARGQFSPTVAVPFNVLSRETPEDCWNRPAVLVPSTAEEQTPNQIKVASSDNDLGGDEWNGESANLNRCDSQERSSFDHVLPDSLFASPTKSSGDHHSDFSILAEATVDLVEKARTTEIRDSTAALPVNNITAGDGPSPSH